MNMNATSSNMATASMSSYPGNRATPRQPELNLNVNRSQEKGSVLANKSNPQTVVVPNKLVQLRIGFDRNGMKLSPSISTRRKGGHLAK